MADVGLGDSVDGNAVGVAVDSLALEAANERADFYYRLWSNKQ